MTEIELLTNCWEIAIESLKNARFGVIDVGRMNETLIELRKRLTELGVDVNTLSQ